ncbi:acyltransferase [Nitrincola lacisaponensis]|uniref:acyltransferase n=1 Tax=Nitrincola lacisaponensis TaxID=267850 RepID=UPI00068B7903|nr:DapH/DapD/GlmU-related protein [Nitrincola lacisaponensis]
MKKSYLKKLHWLVHVTLRQSILYIQTFILNRIYGMHIHKTALISLKAKLDKTNPKGIYIDEGTYVAFGAVVLTHDMSRNYKADVKIGKNCFIGCNSIILPGVEIGDSVVIGAGAVVSKNIPSNVMVAGNPAVIIKDGIKTGRLGIIIRDV